MWHRYSASFYIEKMGRNACGVFVLSCTVAVGLPYCLTAYFHKLSTHTYVVGTERGGVCG
jgi:hypothetical protein